MTAFSQMWYNEVKDFPKANVGSYSSNGGTDVVGHYTQLVWGSTKKIGCGWIEFEDINAPSYKYRKTLICNYGPGGNVLNTKMYTVAAAGSKCTAQDDGLCIS